MAWLKDEQKREKWFNFVQTFSPNIDAQAVRLMDEFYAVSRAIFHANEHSAGTAGVSSAQYKVLMHLFFAEKMGDQGQLNPSEISSRQGVSRNTMSAFIRNLEDEGLVERQLDPADRRRFNISLTTAGRDLVSQHARQHLEAIAQCFSSLSQNEQETMLTLLNKVGKHVTQLVR